MGFIFGNYWQYSICQAGSHGFTILSEVILQVSRQVAVASHQVGEGAGLDHVTVVHDNNPVDVRKPASNMCHQNPRLRDGNMKETGRLIVIPPNR